MWNGNNFRVLFWRCVIIGSRTVLKTVGRWNGLGVRVPPPPRNFGEMAERSNAAVLKTVGRDERPGGSNPSLSAGRNRDLDGVKKWRRLLVIRKTILMEGYPSRWRGRFAKPLGRVKIGARVRASHPPQKYWPCSSVGRARHFWVLDYL